MKLKLKTLDKNRVLRKNLHINLRDIATGFRLQVFYESVSPKPLSIYRRAVLRYSQLIVHPLVSLAPVAKEKNLQSEKF